MYEGYFTSTFDYIKESTTNFIEVILYGSKLENVVNRFGATLLSRQIFLASRIGITFVSVILGIMGIIVMRMKKYKIESNFFLAWAFSLIPFMIFAGLVMKGEFYERFALVSSVPLAVSTVYFFKEYRINFIIILVFLLILSPFYFVGKYGNEAYESISMERMGVNCYSYELNSDCAKNYKIIDNSLKSYEDFGKTHFVISREEIMSNSIFYNKDVNTITDSINARIEEYKLNRIYSTNTASFYRY
jgi:hypothetical protein